MVINCLPLNGKTAIHIPLAWSRSPSAPFSNSYPKPQNTEQGLGKVASVFCLFACFVYAYVLFFDLLYISFPLLIFSYSLTRWHIARVTLIIFLKIRLKIVKESLSLWVIWLFSKVEWICYYIIWFFFYFWRYPCR